MNDHVKNVMLIVVSSVKGDPSPPRHAAIAAETRLQTEERDLVSDWLPRKPR